MGTLLHHIADQIHHARRVYRNHARISEAQEQFNDESTEPVNRAVLAVQIGGMLESQADRLAASWLARATTFLPTPAKVREMAAEWIRRSDDLFIEAGRR